jgi:hypothetical protein
MYAPRWILISVLIIKVNVWATAIYGCGYLFLPGEYTLQNDVETDGSTCFSILASDNTLEN